MNLEESLFANAKRVQATYYYDALGEDKDFLRLQVTGAAGSQAATIALITAGR